MSEPSTKNEWMFEAMASRRLMAEQAARIAALVALNEVKDAEMARLTNALELADASEAVKDAEIARLRAVGIDPDAEKPVTLQSITEGRGTTVSVTHNSLHGAQMKKEGE